MELYRTNKKDGSLNRLFYLLVHLQGFEPGTHWLRVSCSTNWAKGAFSFSVYLMNLPCRIFIKNQIREVWTFVCVLKLRSSSPRSISIGQLNTLLCLHLRPIKLVVFKWPYSLLGMGYLILRLVSRLDAFSVYLNRTWLPSCAPGGTTGAPEVRPSRSSRTKDRPSQISDAHDR